MTNWKKNIAVYLMAECKEIELKYIALSEVIEEKEQEKIEKYKQEIKIEAEILEEQILYYDDDVGEKKYKLEKVIK